MDIEKIKSLAAIFHDKRVTFETLGKIGESPNPAECKKQCIKYEVARAEMIEAKKNLEIEQEVLSLTKEGDLAMWPYNLKQEELEKCGNKDCPRYGKEFKSNCDASQGQEVESCGEYKSITTEPADVLSRALRALCLTRDYVGEDILPAIEGWEWYDAGMAICKLIPNDPWVEQFKQRTKR